jgi:hypothetical protein
MYSSSLLMISPERFGCTSCNTNQRHLPSSNCEKLKCLKTDNGTEYTNDEFKDFCE